MQPISGKSVTAHFNRGTVSLKLELANGDAITLDNPRSPRPPSLSLWRGGRELCLDDLSRVEFAQWVDRALAERRPTP